MNAHVALDFAARTTVASARKVAIRKRVQAPAIPARPVALPLSVNAHVESVLMGLTFTALAGLAVLMEAVGTSLF